MNRHQLTKEVWKSAQTIKSTRVDVLFSNDYETS